MNKYTTISLVEMTKHNKTKYGYMVEDLACNKEYRLDYDTRYERDNEINSETIREVLLADFYTIAKEIEDEYFIFEGELKVF